MAPIHPTSQETPSVASQRPSRWLGVVIGLISLLATILIGELALRASGFSYRLYPEKIEFGWPHPTAMQDYYQPDQDLLWVPKDYPAKVAALRSDPPDLLFLGDSCTEFGTYEQFFPLHAKAVGLPPIRAEKLGVGGWSSFQGLQQLRRDVTTIRPKVVTIYYGWNDHWIGFGIQDKEIARLRSPLFALLERSRFAQLITKATLAREVGAKSVPLRVSLPDFQENLRAMVKVARSSDIIPVFLTAPSSHRVGKEPEYLRRRHLKDLRQLVPLHRQYVDAVRQVAAETNTPLCDLFADFEGFSEERLETYFYPDGIHLTKEPGQGYDTLAELLARCLKDRGIFEKSQG
ncbi:MAG: hypothetical protein EBZ48_12530 [Proteobacteria bacterium]|nr:hypothetical protein [Pseudomonadota bacterium]